MTADGPKTHGIGAEIGPSAPVSRVGVVGAGTMGAGIAQIAALGGYETRLHDPVPAALDAANDRLHRALAKGATRGLWSEGDAAAAGDRVGAAPNLADLAECDLVVEAAPEDLELKRELFTSLAAVCGPETILATNTSSLPVADIAAGIPGRERVVGMHFFNPPALMRLVEVVATAESSPAALDATTEVGVRMGRTPIRAKDSPGFIANRLARPFSLESLRMLAEGVADAATIDRVVRLGGGFRMGPFELIDLIGLDVNLSVARSFYAQGGEPARWKPSPIQEALVAEGRLGRKSGRGFYDYGETEPKPEPETPESTASTVPFVAHSHKRNSGTGELTLDPAALAEIDPAAGLILPRLLAQIANEAAFALEEAVGSPGDMDTAMRLGFNWPRGPLELTALIGPARAADLLEELRAERGEAYAPAPRLLAEASR
jgi:3-hydroxybutyryl-CoA dehydrogenase